MIQVLSNKYRQYIAASLFSVFYLQVISPLYSFAVNLKDASRNSNYYPPVKSLLLKSGKRMPGLKSRKVNLITGAIHSAVPAYKKAVPVGMDYIGGPSSPETNSFRATGSDNLVNLFTGDFSYSIPLFDVDGYPVNLFYNGGITMEQEASWVGLGWNINPGSVSRNMRGVPDDFDGSDTLKQIQNVKPNKTWGGEVGVDGEFAGIKVPGVNFNVGFSYNNYLGPELDLGAGVSVSIPIIKTEVHEKFAPLDTSQGLNLSFGASAKLSSRSGLTLSPSLNAGLHSVSDKMDIGIGLSTAYNSRTGIKDLNIHSQVSAYHYEDTKKGDIDNYKKSTLNESLINSSISFARPSYIPTLRMPMQYVNYSGQIEVGAGMFGFRGSGTAQGYYSESKIAEGSTTIYKPLVGYMYLENANGHKDAVMDFNRVNDGEVTPNTPIISAPQYDYDIFSIQGEGTGGSIRAYRSDLGFMRDNETTSKDKNTSIGFDIAPPGHYGGNWNIISAPTRSGNWDDANNTLNQTLLFSRRNTNNNSFDNVYFRNPGEATVTNDIMINKIGRDNLVRFKLGGSSVSPRLGNQLEQFNKKTGNALPALAALNNSLQQRDKCTQVITMLTANDTRRVGLDTAIKSYLTSLDANNNLQYKSIPRVGSYRKGNHISEITVLEATGMRYIYGLPVYNTVQKDFTFSVGAVGDPVTNLVNFVSANEPTIYSNHINSNTGIDGYVNMQQTPAYASAFLITGLLSPDYVDITGNGITEDDLGSAVKFNYTKSDSIHRWRTPRNNMPVNANTAHFNVGLKTEKRDNKATINYGEREAWYLHSIESKAMIAIFKTSARSDGKGVKSDMDGTININENADLKLDSILLYTKADIKANGLAGAIPLKTVHFEYNYSLCNGVPENSTAGKLTLIDVYFTFKGQSRASKNMYVFNYGVAGPSADNPQYANNASDRWGTYKPMTDGGTPVNPNGLSNIDYPYTSLSKSADDQYAGAWALKKILLPSGGQMEIQYEADDYAYVQNRRACNMFNIYGLGSSTDFNQGNMLYTVFANPDQNYIYIQLPTALQNTDTAKIRKEIFSKYLDGINQIAFKLNVYMPNGLETLTAYANYDDYGLCTNSTDNRMIYIRLRSVDGKGPLANAAVRFLIDNLPGQAFPGYDMSNPSVADFLKLILISLSSLVSPFENAETQMRSGGKGSTISLANSFVRLNNPSFAKYGGGYRVKRVVVNDNWNAMSGQYNSQYGQDYDYTTSTMVNGVSTIISSGVASYEPSIGSEENPFREILQFENKLPLASAQYGAIEMPALEAFFPSPLVGYSKVTVRSIHRNGTHGDSAVRSAIGKQITEFYTAKDYPSFYSYTPMSNMDYHHNPPFTFLYKETIDRRTTSQGFLVETNDMHGKMKSQAAYSESDENTPMAYTIHTYKNTGSNGLNDKVNFVHNDQSGAVISGNMGIDMELMTDAREFSVISNGINGQAQTDFLSFFPFPAFIPSSYPLESYTENKYRAVTTTKLINYHSIEDSVIVNDKGSTISTVTVAYDAETGSPVVTSTANEFNDPVYNVSYPAYWAYSGTGPANKNIGLEFTGVTFYDGRITSGVTDLTVFESGDELYLTSGSGSSGCIGESSNVSKLWVLDKNKNTTALTVTIKDLVFMDSIGRPFTKNGVSFKIFRSGKRNNLGLTISAATCMKTPIQANVLVINNNDNIVSASAVEYKEKWQTDNDVIVKRVYYTLPVPACSTTELDSVDCTGILEKKINPYVKGLIGNFKPYRSYTYYGSRIDSNASVSTDIRKNGYLYNFSNYWSFNVSNNLVPDYTNTKWIWNSELTKVNAKGQQLETVDPLNRYTAAQYGFNKNLPVAMVQNARYGEAFNEGFEDYGYVETINAAMLYSCNNRYIDFTGNGNIINTDTSATVKAHTGKYVLRLNGNSRITKTINANSFSNFAYNFNFPRDTAKTLNQMGGNFSFTYNSGSYWSTATSAFGTSNLSMDVYPSATNFHYYSTLGTTYIQVTTQQNYSFQMGLSVAYNNPSPQTYSNGFQITISDLNNNLVSSSSISTSTPTSKSITVNILLCPGIYKIQGSATEMYGQSSNFSDSHNQYNWACTNCTSPDYASLSTVSGCSYNKPIASTDSMLNPVFNLVQGNRMQFSAWVQENCDSTVCYKTTYIKNHVELQFPGSASPTVMFYPSGTIIEGWQKIEGVFIVPPDATTANLVLSNDGSGSQTVYFDDIRIHPFNANMKSYVYSPQTLQLQAELDENNYATFYNYDEEGQLIRIKKETIQGIKTIQETRTAKQKIVQTIQ